MVDTPTALSAALQRKPPANALSHLRALQPDGVSAILADHLGHRLDGVGSLSTATALGSLGSSLLSVGDGLVRQVGGPWSDHIVVTSAERQIVTLPVGDGSSNLLVVVAPRQVSLGPVLWAARRCCADLREAAAAPPSDSSTRHDGDLPETTR